MASSSSSHTKDKDQPINWSELPPELMYSILLRLGVVEILKSAQKVCSSWRRVSKDPFLWRKIDMGNHKRFDYQFAWIIRQAVKHSDGGLLQINFGKLATIPLLKYVSERSSNLRSLTFDMSSRIPNKGLLSAISKLPLLEELEIHVSCTLSKPNLKAIGHSCPRLKTFKLKLKWYRIKRDDDALAIAETMPQLHHLQLLGNKLTDTGLNAILDNCPHLDHLDLRKCFNVRLAGNLENRCLERIKVFRRPNESIDDYEFDSTYITSSMGVVEDTHEPPSKRVKRLADDPSGCKEIIEKREFIRTITRAGAILEEESWMTLHNPVVKVFLKQVMVGKWDESIVTLHYLRLLDEKAVKSVSFLLLEQKFLELLRMEKITDALSTLRNEILPLHINTKRVQELADSLVSPITLGSGKERSEVLEELLNLLPVSLTISEKRDPFVFHNTLDNGLSLFFDPQCGKHHIPSQTVQILESHTDEVWFVQFSHDGKYLASSSKDQTAIIWEIDAKGHISMKHKLVGHQKPVFAILWSHDDRQVLTCEAEEVIRRWDVNSGKCVHMYEKGSGWYPQGQGMTDRINCISDLDGKELEFWKDQRTHRKWLVSVCKDSVISLFDRETKVERWIEEEDMITSFSLSNDNHILVNLDNQNIHLWNIEGHHPKIVSRYNLGHKHSQFIIRSCFGGYKQAFIASGSEVSQVYIWHRTSGKLINKLQGHAGVVNCVSWSPTNHHMLASASNDGTIRIWGPDQVNQTKQVQGSSSNSR